MQKTMSLGKLSVARSPLACLVCAGALSVCLKPTEAAELPQWEFGMGGSAISLPKYRGSNQQSAYILPFPTFVYRDENFQVDRDKVRGIYLGSDRLELDVSFNGTLPVKSKDTPARLGMPDLIPTLEVGPSINATLIRSDDRQAQLFVKLPLRAVIATNLQNVSNAGLTFQPQLALDVKNIANTGWHLGGGIGPIFYTRKYVSYFYDVAPSYATASRPAYQSSAGYGGVNLTIGASKRFGDFWLGFFVKADSLSGATFADSPLVKSNSAFSTGIAMTWRFAESIVLVKIND
jgi:MipA family protein